jgi:hypothetical protein
VTLGRLRLNCAQQSFTVQASVATMNNRNITAGLIKFFLINLYEIAQF